MDNKKKKVLGIVVNAVVIVILVFVGLITLSIILSAGKGYTNVFGNAYVAVQSDSMEGADELYAGNDATYSQKGFNQGDLIRVRVLSDAQKSEVKVGDIITFYQTVGSERILNTHRVIAVTKGADGSVTKFTTQGDKAKSLGLSTTEEVTLANVIGVYEGHRLAGLGNVSDFFHSPAGFFVCVVLPSFLIVAYFAFNLFLTVKSVKASYKAVDQKEEEAKMREKIMQELREQGKIVDATPENEPTENKSENSKDGE